MEKVVEKQIDEKKSAVLKAMKVAFWIRKENVSITKFDSMISLLENLECPDIFKLQTGQNITYNSDKSACEFISSVATTIRRTVSNQIERSPFVSILCDESTDIGVKKKVLNICMLLILKHLNHQPYVFVIMRWEVARA
jgi:hypothetical protein